MRCIRKENPNIFAVAHHDWHYDIMPAGIHLARGSHPEGDVFLCSAPKGFIYKRTFKNPDGSIKHRGWESVLDILEGHHLINRDRVTRYINRELAGLVV